MGKIKEQLAPTKTIENISEIILLISTSKGGFIYYSDHKRRNWEVNGPFLLGSIVHHMVLDPRDGRTMLMAAQTKEHGPTIFKSFDMGMTWKPVSNPPKFKDSRSIAHVFRLVPGHASQPGTWYAGTSPQGLFNSEDNGDNWNSIDSFNEGEIWHSWCPVHPGEGLKYQKVHSINIDINNKDHLIVGMASGGTFESIDMGKTWDAINSGIHNITREGVPGDCGFDPHCVLQHPMDSNRIYQQNQCGIFRMDLPTKTWTHIGDNIEVGDIGFSICLNPTDPETLWAFPMEGTDIWSRVCTGGRPGVYCTVDGGNSWFRQDIGLPMWHAWFTVMSRAMIADHLDPVAFLLVQPVDQFGRVKMKEIVGVRLPNISLKYIR